MKAYVIKNKEEKYLYEDGYVKFGEKICYAHIEKEKENAEILAGNCSIILKDCQVVEITIAEGDLEEENRILKKALELACEKIEFMAQMLGQTLDYNVEENFIEQAKGEKDE